MVVLVFSRLKVIVVALLLFSHAFIAYDSKAQVIRGDTTCADWIEGRTTGRAGNFEYWALGTLNGIALGSKIEFWQTQYGELQVNEAFLWIDQWCRDVVAP
jgi:hypothetical protein